MAVRGIRLRAILVPLGVAIVSVAALAWYGLVQIPAQQQYLNERNLRLLRTLSGQIRSRVDNFDRAIDHALDSFTLLSSKSEIDEEDLDKLDKYVHGYAPELAILRVAPRVPPPTTDPSIEDQLLQHACDPPRMAVRRDEGRNFLYLGAKPDLKSRSAKPDLKSRSSIRIVARADLEQVVADYLAPRKELDVLLLVAKDGLVIAQQTSTGLNLARLDRLPEGPPDSHTDVTRLGESANVFETLRMTGNSTDVTLGGAQYRLYVQPVQLSLLSLDTGQLEEWALCGLVSASHFRGESSAMPYTYLLWFSAALATVWFAIPLVKLRVIGASERLRAHDGAWVATTTFLVAGLLTFAILDAYFFGHEFATLTDNRLQNVALSLISSLSDEVDAISNQMKRFDEQTSWHDALNGANRADVLHEVRSDAVKVTPRLADQRSGQNGVDCPAHRVCAPALLQTLWGSKTRKTPMELSYPFFDLVVWDDDDGFQRVKWSSRSGMTPFINVKEDNLPYYKDLERAWRLSKADSAGSEVPSRGLSVFQSPNTGEQVTAFWRATQSDEPDGNTPRVLNWGESLAVGSPISLDQPMLPQYVRFAVIDDAGKVIFHSDKTRNLQENLLKECEDNATLQSLLASRSRGLSTWLTAYYLGRPHRLYVTPLDSRTVGGFKGFVDPKWSLVVFQDSAVGQTINLETLTVALCLFAVFGAGLAVASFFQSRFSRQTDGKWFWPDPRKARRYERVALVNAVLSLIFVVFAAHLDGALLLAAAILMTTAAALVTYLIIAKPIGPSEQFNSLREFWMARTAFLFAIATVPAIACFQIAYNFEMALFVKSDQAHQRMNRDARDKRNTDHILESVALDNDLIEKLLSQRAETTWDIHTVPLVQSDEHMPVLSSRWGGFDAWLGWIHRPYNEFAVDLKAAGSTEAALSTAAPRASPSGWWWYALMVATLVVALFLLLHGLVRPLYALGARLPLRSSTEPDVREMVAPVLLVGPPGSGKSARLARDQRIRVFDIRTQRFVERRQHAIPVPLERRLVVSAAGAGAGSTLHDMGLVVHPDHMERSVEAPEPPGAWADGLDLSTLHTDGDDLIGIDHLDYRLDEPEFRKQTLSFLEAVIYRYRRKALIVSDRDPFSCIEENRSGSGNHISNECDRWVQMLPSFRRESVGISDEPRSAAIDALSHRARNHGGLAPAAVEAVVEEASPALRLITLADSLLSRISPGASFEAEDIRRALSTTAEPYYRALWGACSVEEKLVLRQLAEERLVNPRSKATVTRLLRAGLIIWDPTLRIMNETFRRFIVRAVPADQIAAWEVTDVRLPWASIEIAMITLLVGIAVLLVLTQQQLVSAWTGFVPAIAPAVPTLMRLFATVQSAKKEVLG